MREKRERKRVTRIQIVCLLFVGLMASACTCPPCVESDPSGETEGTEEMISVRCSDVKIGIELIDESLAHAHEISYCLDGTMNCDAAQKIKAKCDARDGLKRTHDAACSGKISTNRPRICFRF